MWTKKYCHPPLGSRCGSAVKWWKWENNWNREDPGLLPTLGNLFFKKILPPFHKQPEIFGVLKYEGIIML
jgi:hypothetical protein